MGYYHIQLDPTSRALCMLVLPWGKYKKQQLPMGLSNSPDIFQEKMSKLMVGLEFVQMHINNSLVISKGKLKDHLNKLVTVLKRIENAGLKINATKLFFCQAELEYLGYWITREAIMPIPKKINVMLNINAAKNWKELCLFIGLVNYYRDMWICQSNVLAPLTNLTSKDFKWQWTGVKAQAFSDIKQILANKVLLLHPNSKEFNIHTNASSYQLSAVISKGNKPIALYSRKLNSAQNVYTTTEKELLAIMETLKEFKNILMGHRIIVHTDHNK